MNPLIPNGFDMTFTFLGIINFVLWLVAIIKVGLDKYLPISHKWILFLFATLIPFLGPIGALIATKKIRTAERASKTNL